MVHKRNTAAKKKRNSMMEESKEPKQTNDQNVQQPKEQSSSTSNDANVLSKFEQNLGSKLKKSLPAPKKHNQEFKPNLKSPQPKERPESAYDKIMKEVEDTLKEYRRRTHINGDENVQQPKEQSFSSSASKETDADELSTFERNYLDGVTMNVELNPFRIKDFDQKLEDFENDRIKACVNQIKGTMDQFAYEDDASNFLLLFEDVSYGMRSRSFNFIDGLCADIRDATVGSMRYWLESYLQSFLLELCSIESNCTAEFWNEIEQLNVVGAVARASTRDRAIRHVRAMQCIERKCHNLGVFYALYTQEIIDLARSIYAKVEKLLNAANVNNSSNDSANVSAQCHDNQQRKGKTQCLSTSNEQNKAAKQLGEMLAEFESERGMQIDEKKGEMANQPNNVQQPNKQPSSSHDSKNKNELSTFDQNLKYKLNAASNPTKVGKELVNSTKVENSPNASAKVSTHHNKPNEKASRPSASDARSKGAKQLEEMLAECESERVMQIDQKEGEMANQPNNNVKQPNEQPSSSHASKNKNELSTFDQNLKYKLNMGSNPKKFQDNSTTLRAEDFNRKLECFEKDVAKKCAIVVANAEEYCANRNIFCDFNMLSKDFIEMYEMGFVFIHGLCADIRASAAESKRQLLDTYLDKCASELKPVMEICMDECWNERKRLYRMWTASGCTTTMRQAIAAAINELACYELRQIYGKFSARITDLARRMFREVDLAAPENSSNSSANVSTSKQPAGRAHSPSTSNNESNVVKNLGKVVKELDPQQQSKEPEQWNDDSLRQQAERSSSVSKNKNELSTFDQNLKYKLNMASSRTKVGKELVSSTKVENSPNACAKVSTHHNKPNEKASRPSASDEQNKTIGEMVAECESERVMQIEGKKIRDIVENVIANPEKHTKQIKCLFGNDPGSMFIGTQLRDKEMFEEIRRSVLAPIADESKRRRANQYLNEYWDESSRVVDEATSRYRQARPSLDVPVTMAWKEQLIMATEKFHSEFTAASVCARQNLCEKLKNLMDE